MPNQPRCDLRLVAYRLPIELMVKVAKFAKAQNCPEKQVVIDALMRETANVELTFEDIELIKQEVKQNEQKRARG